MKVKRIQGSDERAVLIAMIVDSAVLGAITSRWTDGMMSSRWGNLIAGWCISYYKRYKKPPGRDIQTIFDSWANEAKRDTDTVQAIEKLLTSLSGQYKATRESTNSAYIIDLASSYFTRVGMKDLAATIEAALEENDLDAAEAAIQKFSKIQVGANYGINVLGDKEAIKRAFLAKKEPLIQYEHGLGIFFGSALERDGFIAFTGTEKKGKTWLLLDIAWQSMLQGKKVAFFEVGDLSESQIMMRFMTRAAQVPTQARIKKSKVVKVPTGIILTEDGECEVDYEEREFTKGLVFDDAWAACQKILKKKKTKEPLLRLSTHPNFSINIYGIQAILESWERGGFVPDVVVIDYADILAPPSGVIDSREAINTTWKMMRGLSQTFHCLLVTATQAKASAYDADTLGQEHFSEDKRKHAHVTGMVGMNQTNTEKEKGVIRLNWIELREEEFIQSKCCHVGQCLSLASPMLCSVMES